MHHGGNRRRSSSIEQAAAYLEAQQPTAARLCGDERAITRIYTPSFFGHLLLFAVLARFSAAPGSISLSRSGKLHYDCSNHAVARHQSIIISPFPSGSFTL